MDDLFPMVQKVGKREEQLRGELRGLWSSFPLCLDVDLLFFGEVVGTEGGEMLVCLLQPRSSGLGSVRSGL